MVLRFRKLKQINIEKIDVSNIFSSKSFTDQVIIIIMHVFFKYCHILCCFVLLLQKKKIQLKLK